MDRRVFLTYLLGVPAVITSPIWADPVTWKSEEELERDLLEDFLSPKDEGIERKDISRLLQRIQKNGRTISGGVHIGEGYHLTNYHVIEDGMDGLSVNAQNPFYTSFEDRRLG